MKAALLAVLLVAAVVATAQESTLADFELQDQFDQVYTDEDFAGSVLVLIGGNRKGSRYTGAWTRTIQDSLENHSAADNVAVVGLADLRGVPSFIRGRVKTKFPQDPQNWVLMDWKGRLPKAYAFEPGFANILIFDRNGLLVHQTHAREVDEDRVRALASKISDLLDSSRSASSR